ncbi:bromodomain and WD repeat-containing protein 1 isoform X3 [Rosa chinensis]|uniref:bromodomain and WD repeat-containing protein 1 isoform X3 n=1 Tax=Rosa chinensis TaxID=74649 RepID=UPI001AD8BC0E|nr:bromodomain and WD repeat-containing protein 1 isoform X3 [Rosa chinensis]
MSSKRFGKSKLLREGYRKSPRLSALEDWKACGTRIGAIAGNTSTQQMKSYLGYDQGPASRTRGTKKTRLTPYDEAAYSSRSASPKFGPVETSQEDNQTSSDHQVLWSKDVQKPASTDQQSSALSALWLPEKQKLELVLDILQRRDTNEIFAEPVNPNEVQDYYEIIEEPMDFGTMRAKLHDGMYKNLQQFEHDAFLVTENAMHFNSSATIYFRQARSIHDLAKKVFHILKTYPEKLESEFSEARKRTGRRSQVEIGKSHSCPKVATNMKHLGMKIGGSSKAMRSSLSGSLNTRKCLAKTGCSGTDTQEQKLLSGTKDDGGSMSFEADRRYTYRPWRSFLSENESVGLTLSTDLKQLEHVNRQDIGYRESLMSFVKDLGPTAKMIARKKILGCLQLQQSDFPLASTSTQRAPTTTAFAAAPSHGRHPTIMKTTRTTFQLPSSGDQNNSHAEFYPNHRNEIHQLDFYPLKPHNGSDCSSIASGFQNTSNKSTAMILNQGKFPNQLQSLVSPSESHSNVLRNLEIASLSNESCTYKLTPAPLRGDDDETKATHGRSHEFRSLSHTSQMPKPDQVNPVVARQFAFDLPYLRAQLGTLIADAYSSTWSSIFLYSFDSHVRTHFKVKRLVSFI